MSREPIKYNVSELSSELDEGYICPICLESYFKKEIYQCKEGHCSCKECWIKSLENKKECMQCKIKVNSFNELSRARQVERFLLKICVCCPYSFKNIIRVDESEKLIKDGWGCNEIVKLEELDNHIENCNFRFVKCKYYEIGCMDQIRYNQNEFHISKCEYQPLNCTHCSNVYLLKIMEQHYLECPSMLIDCKECNEKIKREEMYMHIDKECQEVVISCKFLQFGCNDKIKRKNLENHLDQTNHSKHLSTVLESLINKNNQLSNSIDYLTKGKELMASTIEDLVIKNNLLLNSIDYLTKGKEYMASTIEDLNIKNNLLSDSINELIKGKELMASTIEDLVIKNNLLLNSIDYLTKGKEYMSSTIEDLNIKNNLLSDSINELIKGKENLIIKNNQLSNSIDELLKGKENLIIKNNELSNSIAELSRGKEYKNKWIISNYSKIFHSPGQFLKSPPFGYAPYFFHILIYKNGMDTSDIGNIGVFLSSGDNNNQKNISFSIALLNYYSENNYSYSFKNSDITPSGFGWNCFINGNHMNIITGYVKEDDKVEFEFTLTYPPPNPLLSN
ncbi:hypothetical protein DICPUDRAFT_99195 [Dictyostelium purpureum]|uniref:TRAF-type domain-containing protein n=1 Tax=Dictyostelium purpureum TaxID=5786 RepID=F0ZX22_DICPU|nr:uncharacterized protein DICPUDRAFT_99195 [Dictyostelium purpureum]EGC31511.1 hypothetical protein DICPUDRAFT_99195 [Dictyostelium purpureum]|eukprot:XP_003291963.1 hypothetical protein DICPUDRAFT_99195 [Dictyostelium purpureum]